MSMRNPSLRKYWQGSCGAGYEIVVCGLSSSPFIDLAGAKMLHDLHGELSSRGIAFQIVGARGQVRDVLQADGLAEKTDSANWTRRMDSLLGDLNVVAPPRA